MDLRILEIASNTENNKVLDKHTHTSKNTVLLVTWTCTKKHSQCLAESWHSITCPGSLMSWNPNVLILYGKMILYGKLILYGKMFLYGKGDYVQEK